METRTHLMVKMAFLPTLIPLVRVCREMPTLTTMSIGLWAREQVIRKTKIYNSNVNI